jgi:hypothetical protein
MGIYNAGYGNFDINDSFLKEATKTLYAHKIEIDEYLNNSQKLGAVKLLKELTGGGLKETKEVIDLYTAGKLPPSIKEERQKKLERLAKKPLADSITNKILNIEEDKLNTFLLNLSIDELLLIDEIFPNEEESII